MDPFVILGISAISAYVLLALLALGGLYYAGRFLFGSLSDLKFFAYKMCGSSEWD